MSFYIIKNNIPVKEPDVKKWGEWFQDANRIIKADVINKNITISTIFLGMDFSGIESEPILFETMVFWNNKIEHKWNTRYSNIDDAKSNHSIILEALNKELENNKDDFLIDLFGILNKLEINKLK